MSSYTRTRIVCTVPIPGAWEAGFLDDDGEILTSDVVAFVVTRDDEFDRFDNAPIEDEFKYDDQIRALVWSDDGGDDGFGTIRFADRSDNYEGVRRKGKKTRAKTTTVYRAVKRGRVTDSSSSKKRKKGPAEEPTAPLPIAPWKLPEGLDGIALCAAEHLAEASKPIVYAIDRLAQPKDVILLSGPPKVSFKTMLAVSLATAMFSGGKWLGFNVVKGKPRRVLFISPETRGPVLVRRVIKQCEAQGLDPAVACKYLHIIDQRVKFEPGGILEKIAAPDTWSLVVVDTMRQCMIGNENDSEDVAEFTEHARQLARKCGCPVLVIHHSKKNADQSAAESSRGSGEVIGGPDVLINIDASGKHPTAHFLCRNDESPPPVGYAFRVDGEGLVLDVLPPSSGTKNGIGADDVLRAFEAYPNDGLTESKVRELVAKARGGKEGSKANPKHVAAHIKSLLGLGAISECEIETKGKGKTASKRMKGYRLGTAGGIVPAIRIDADGDADGNGGVDDVG